MFELILAVVMGNLLTILPIAWLAIYFKDDIKEMLFSSTVEDSAEQVGELMGEMAQSLGGQLGNQVQNATDEITEDGGK